MMRELDFLEIAFAAVIPEPALLAQMSRLLEVAPATLWNWAWPGEPPGLPLVNVRYLVHPDDDARYPLLVALSFSQPLVVAVDFARTFGVALAHCFGCNALINDPRDPHGRPDSLLQIRPDGQVQSCLCDGAGPAQRQYCPVGRGLSGPYQQAIRHLEAAARRQTLVADFYTGFEGEPEITFVRTGQTTYTLTTWEGYFDQVMAAMEPGPEGTWQGLALPYHLHTGWYAGAPFRVEDPALLAAQFAALDLTALEPSTARFCQALHAFVQNASTQNEALHLRQY